MPTQINQNVQNLRNIFEQGANPATNNTAQWANSRNVQQYNQAAPYNFANTQPTLNGVQQQHTTPLENRYLQQAQVVSQERVNTQTYDPIYANIDNQPSFEGTSRDGHYHTLTQNDGYYTDQYENTFIQTVNGNFYLFDADSNDYYQDEHGYYYVTPQITSEESSPLIQSNNGTFQYTPAQYSNSYTANQQPETIGQNQVYLDNTSIHSSLSDLSQTSDLGKEEDAYPIYENININDTNEGEDVRVVTDREITLDNNTYYAPEKAGNFYIYNDDQVYFKSHEDKYYVPSSDNRFYLYDVEQQEFVQNKYGDLISNNLIVNKEKVISGLENSFSKLATYKPEVATQKNDIFELFYNLTTFAADLNADKNQFLTKDPTRDRYGNIQPAAHTAINANLSINRLNGQGEPTLLAGQFPKRNQTSVFLTTLASENVKTINVISTPKEINESQKDKENKIMDMYFDKGSRMLDNGLLVSSKAKKTLNSGDKAEIQQYRMEIRKPNALGRLLSNKRLESMPSFLQNIFSQKQHSFNVNHFTQWVDLNPLGADDLEKAHNILKSSNSNENPLNDSITHCRAGVGRTGQLITAMQLLEGNYSSLEAAIKDLREKRSPLMVQTKEQYFALAELAIKHNIPLFEENVNEEGAYEEPIFVDIP